MLSLSFFIKTNILIFVIKLFKYTLLLKWEHSQTSITFVLFTDGQLLRRSVPKYADGVYHPSGPNRPNPLDISRAAHHGHPNGGSERSRNALLVFFGMRNSYAI